MSKATMESAKAAVPSGVGQSIHPTSQQTAQDDGASTAPLTRSLSRISTREQPEYKVYKRRFFGLFQLCLLNIVVSWDWIAFAPVSRKAAEYFATTETVTNWLSTAFFFAFVAATPFTFYALSRRGPRFSILTASILLLIGNWIKYGGTKAAVFPAVMLGQLFIGFAQPFVLSAPTTYSNYWFSPSGRTTATAVASLSNPFGAALGQLISPFWVSSASQIPNSILYVSIIATVACIPSFFIPAKPPTPPTASSERIDHSHSIKSDVLTLFKSVEFYLIFVPFSIYVGFFNAFSSLLNQILEPYGFSEDDAGLAGAVLILVGLVSAVISSPLIDKYKTYLLYIKIAVPIIALMYLIFIWAPMKRSISYVYVVCGVLGAASFGLVPVVLEFLVEMHYPLGPETGSTLCWSGGQLLGGVFVVIMNALKDPADKSHDANFPPSNMTRALIFQAVLALAAMPLPLCLGLFGRGDKVRRRRWEIEQSRQGRGNVDFEAEPEGERRATVVTES